MRGLRLVRHPTACASPHGHDAFFSRTSEHGHGHGLHCAIELGVMHIVVLLCSLYRTGLFSSDDNSQRSIEHMMVDPYESKLVKQENEKQNDPVSTSSPIGLFIRMVSSGAVDESDLQKRHQLPRCLSTGTIRCIWFEGIARLAALVLPNGRNAYSLRAFHSSSSFEIIGGLPTGQGDVQR